MESDIIFGGSHHVEWGKLQGAYGVSPKIEEALRELCSSDQRRRSDALDYIWDYAHHQYSVYELTYAVVPVLMNLLRYEQTVRETVDLGDGPQPMLIEILEFLSSCRDTSGNDVAMDKLLAQASTSYQYYSNDRNPKVREFAKSLAEAYK